MILLCNIFTVSVSYVVSSSPRLGFCLLVNTSSLLFRNKTVLKMTSVTFIQQAKHDNREISLFCEIVYVNLLNVHSIHLINKMAIVLKDYIIFLIKLSEGGR